MATIFGNGFIVGTNGLDTIIGDVSNDTIFGHELITPVVSTHVAAAAGKSATLSNLVYDVYNRTFWISSVGAKTTGTYTITITHNGTGFTNTITGSLNANDDYLDPISQQGARVDVVDLSPYFTLGQSYKISVSSDTLRMQLQQVSYIAGDGDVISASDGDDIIYGSRSITTDAPSDAIYAGYGNDTVYGLSGSDVIYAGAGNDLLSGDSGNDTIYGEDGNDTIYGGSDKDFLSGGSGNDLIYGGIAKDELQGDDGHDTLYGEAGNDLLFGGSGNDFIYGGLGDDYIVGEEGGDKIYGGEGNDTIFGGDERDVIYGDDGNDQILGDNGNDALFGGLGNDTIRGDAGNDSILGGAGNDQLLGSAGNDTLSGEAGDDMLRGGSRTVGEIDILTGGAGKDRFVLADSSGTYYDDGIATNSGHGDYALIKDFKVGEDRLTLKGNAGQYFIRNSPIAGISGQALIFDTNGNGVVNTNDELIAIFQGSSGLNSVNTIQTAAFV